jgi:Rrf2 family protein
MRISSKLLYALRALFDISFHNFGKPTKVDQIAEREEVPPRFLEQIFQDLKAAGLIGSKRGPHGGYFLLRSPDSVTVGDVWRAVEGPLEHPCCFLTDDEMREGCEITSKCVTSAVWRDVTIEMERVLDSFTLSDLSLKGESLGLKRDAEAGFSYVI